MKKEMTMKKEIKMKKLMTVFLATLIIGLPWAEAKDMSYEELISQLYDMKYLATQPRPGEKSGNFSSRDRGAKYDKATGKYENWFANSDGGGFMDHAGTMMKLEGPGVIWRIWSAMPKKGAVKFYVDGSETPVLEGPFIEMFNNTKPPFNFPELVHMKGRGQNFFIPIPFQKSIRIVGEKGWGRFYQITYTKFPEGTTVPSFNGKVSDRERAALQKANEIWGKRGPRLFVSGKAKETTVDLTLEHGKEKEIALFNEPGAISSIVMKRPEMDREASVEILRQLSISITWDKEKEPAVWAPLGDFFGTAGGENLYRSLATGMTKDSYYANWYMPFGRARIVVRNDAKTAQTLRFAIHTEKVKGEVDKLLRYHCKWHRDDFSGFDKELLQTERWPDWPVLKIDGAAGRFCGFQAHMWNPNHLWNKECRDKYEKPFPEGDAFKPGGKLHDLYMRDVGRHYWWGEGDEKFFVDGEKMPSTFGTGTEDYFGYAWGTAQAFDSALQAQPRNGTADEIGKRAGNNGPGNMGHITMVRWQIADNVPFQKSFEATVEKYHPNNWPLLNAYAASWYQTAGTEDYYKAVPPSERSNYFIPATAKSRGKRVFFTGHSFFILNGYMAKKFDLIAKATVKKDHEMVGWGYQPSGSGAVDKWWDKGADEEPRKSVAAGKVDILTVCTYWMKKGSKQERCVRNFVKLMQESNPDGLVYLITTKPPRDGKYEGGWDARTKAELAKLYGYIDAGHRYANHHDALVDEINKAYGKTVIKAVPLYYGQALMRAQIIDGKVPGVKKQSEIYSDAMGHVSELGQRLNAYTVFVAIYGESPFGLRVPEWEKSGDFVLHDQNRSLQKAAWSAVQAVPVPRTRRNKSIEK